MTIGTHRSTLSKTCLIKSTCVVSLEAPDSEKWEISGTDDQLLLCYIFQVSMFNRPGVAGAVL